MKDAEKLRQMLDRSPCRCGKQKRAEGVAIIGPITRREHTSMVSDRVVLMAPTECLLCGHRGRFSALFAEGGD